MSEEEKLDKAILDKEGTIVGKMEVLDDSSVAIYFHGKYMGVFNNFDGWNSQHGMVYKLSNFGVLKSLDQIEIDLELTDEDYNW